MKKKIKSSYVNQIDTVPQLSPITNMQCLSDENFEHLLDCPIQAQQFVTVDIEAR
jgi:hypothetical protein